MSPPEPLVQVSKQFDAGLPLQKLNHNSPEKPRFPIVPVLIDGVGWREGKEEETESFGETLSWLQGMGNFPGSCF